MQMKSLKELAEGGATLTSNADIDERLKTDEPTDLQDDYERQVKLG